MKNSINLIFSSLLIFVITYFLFIPTIQAQEENEPVLQDALLRDFSEEVVFSSDPATRRAMEKEKLNRHMNQRNEMMDELMSQANEMMEREVNPISLEQVQDYVVDGTKVVDKYFEDIKTGACSGQDPKGGLLKVYEFHKKQSLFAYNEDVLNSYLGVLSISVDKGKERRRGTAIVYKSEGKVKVISTAHSFYGEAGDSNIESIVKGAKNKDVELAYSLNATVMDPNSADISKRDRFGVSFDNLDCGTKTPTKLPVEEIYKDRCEISLREDAMESLLNFGTEAKKIEPFSLISDKELKALGSKVYYFMVSAGNESKLYENEVVRTVTMCTDVQLGGQFGLVSHKCNTENHHSGGALIAVTEKGARFLVAIHRGAKLKINTDPNTNAKSVDKKKSFNRAVRILN
ncbi:MAG: hypothetical protein HOO06_11845 [Bdellovibrionaceae bacterium]|jgi:hypothetical protein|nr:hypothetical protein [Pseudobdellovibrionaceae bacterium]